MYELASESHFDDRAENYYSYIVDTVVVVVRLAGLPMERYKTTSLCDCGSAGTSAFAWAIVLILGADMNSVRSL